MVQRIDTSFLAGPSIQGSLDRQQRGFEALGQGIVQRFDRERKEEQLDEEMEWRKTQMEMDVNKSVFNQMSKGRSLSEQYKIAKELFPNTYKGVEDTFKELSQDQDEIDEKTFAVTKAFSDEYEKGTFKNNPTRAMNWMTEKLAEQGIKMNSLSDSQRKAVRDNLDILKRGGEIDVTTKGMSKRTGIKFNELAQAMYADPVTNEPVNPADLSPAQRLDVKKAEAVLGEVKMANAGIVISLSQKDKNIARLKRIKQKFSDPNFTKQFGLWNTKWKEFSNKYLTSENVDFTKAQKDIDGLVDILYDISGKQLAVQEMEIAMKGILPTMLGSAVNAEVAIDKLIEKTEDGVRFEREALERAGKFDTIDKLEDFYDSFASSRVSKDSNTPETDSTTPPTQPVDKASLKAGYESGTLTVDQIKQLPPELQDAYKKKQGL